MFGRPPPPPPPPSSSSSSSSKKKKFIHVRNIDGISIFVETSSGMPVWVLPAGVDIQKDIQYICILNDDRTHYFKDFNTNAISHDLPEQDMSGNARSVCYALLAYNNDQCTSFMENPYNAAASKAQDDSLNRIIKKLYSSNSIKTDSKTTIDNNEDDAYYFDNKNDNDDDKDDDNNRLYISETNRESNIYMRQSEVGNEIFIEGYLMKLARSSERNWKKRYFVLSRTAISYYSKGRPLIKSLGDLIITSDTTVKEHDEELHGYAFRISNQYGTIKMAGSKEEVTEWIDKIASLIIMNKKMCCDYLQKRSYRLGFTSNVKKFFVLTEDKITVHPSAEKASYVEAMIRINDSSQITYDDKSYRMTFIDSIPNASKNELTIQFPDSGLEFGAWRSFILKNITIDEVNFKVGTSNSMPPPPPPPPLVQTSSSNASRTSMKKDTLISPIAKVPTTPTASDDNDSFNTFDATSSTTGMNALQAAKARREARNSETKQQPPAPSRPFMSKLTASIPFYGANQSESVKRTSTQSVEPAVFGINPLSDTNDDDDDNDEKANATNNETMNDSTQADDISMEIDINLSDNNNKSKPTTTGRNSTDSSSRFSFRSARKMFEKKNVSFDNENLAKSKDVDAYEAKAYPEGKNYDTNSSSVNGIKVSKYAIKLADLNTSTSLLSSPQELNTSLPSPSSSASSASSSPLPPPPTSPYLSLLQTDIIDINPNTNLMRSFDHAKDTPSMTNRNANHTSVSESVTNPTYKRNTKSESYSNTMHNTYSSKNEQSSMHSIENFVASISSSREDMIRQFHNNVQQINVFVKEPKESKELRTKIQKDSKYCQTDQRIYMDDIHRRPYEILVAEKEELIIAREKLALDVTTALAHIKKEEEASLKKIKEFDVQMKQKYDDIAAQLDAKKVKQEEDHKQLVESFELTRKAADHLHKKRLVELQVVARSMAKHHDKIINERQLIAVQRFQLFLALQDLGSIERSTLSTSKFPILKEEVPRVYHPRTLTPNERAEALLVTYGTKAKNVNAKNKVLNNNNKNKKIGRSFVYGGREGPYVPDLNV